MFDAPQPTYYLGTETAEVAPAGRTTVGVAHGTLILRSASGFHLSRGMGLGGELKVHAAYTDPGGACFLGQCGPKDEPSWGWGAGYKQRVATLGGWAVALNGAYGYGLATYVPYHRALLQAPATTRLGPGELTLAPFTYFHDLGRRSSLTAADPAGTGPFGDLRFGARAGYRWPIGSAFALLGEASSDLSGWWSARAGGRLAVGPGTSLDVWAGQDMWGVGRHPAHPENGGVLAAAARLTF